LTLLPQQIAVRLTLAILTSQLPIAAPAQQPPTRTVILLDPAHGGPDTGAHLPNNLLEKDLTLAFAGRLRATLAASGFTVISTRDADPAVPFLTDQRAEIANHAHPAACLVLHITDSGNGIHVVTSTLNPPDTPEEPRPALPWNTAQSASVSQSLSIANEIGLAMQQARLPVLLSRASIRPLDNLICPAVAIEIAPLAAAGSAPTPLTDATYQQDIAKAIGAGLTAWRSRQIAPAPATGGAK
jgi:N-acetylmuramoyl-L-alanine amidase